MIKLLSALQNRLDLSIIAGWIEPDSSVLDLGCGDGSLLEHLVRSKNVRGMGVEIATGRILNCVEKGIPVIEHDLNSPFTGIADRTYDYVILSQTIQEVRHPDRLIEEILRIGRYGIVSFPNFGHYRVRAELLTTGRMPKNRSLPYDWYDTPNIHLMTLKDFRSFCRSRNIRIIRMSCVTGRRHRKHMLWPNLFAEGCVALLSR